jgi:hypothetical protein
MTRLRELIRRHGDPLLAAGLAALGLVQTVADGHLSTNQRLANAVLFPLAGALFAVRRRFPLLVLGTVLAGGAADSWLREGAAARSWGSSCSSRFTRQRLTRTAAGCGSQLR